MSFVALVVLGGLVAGAHRRRRIEERRRWIEQRHELAQALVRQVQERFADLPTLRKIPDLAAEEPSEAEPQADDRRPFELSFDPDEETLEHLELINNISKRMVSEPQLMTQTVRSWLNAELEQ